MAAAALSGLALAACDSGLAGRPAPAFQRAEQPCRDASFPVYFDRGSDQLSAEAHDLILTYGTRMRGCRIGSTEVVGLADAGDDPAKSLDLSRRRADGVARALADAGLPAPKMVVEAAGDSGAKTPAGRPEPLRRRTEVVIHASPAR